MFQLYHKNLEHEGCCSWTHFLFTLSLIFTVFSLNLVIFSFQKWKEIRGYDGEQHKKDWHWNTKWVLSKVTVLPTEIIFPKDIAKDAMSFRNIISENPRFSCPWKYYFQAQHNLLLDCSWWYLLTSWYLHWAIESSTRLENSLLFKINTE